MVVDLIESNNGMRHVRYLAIACADRELFFIANVNHIVWEHVKIWILYRLRMKITIHMYRYMFKTMRVLSVNYYMKCATNAVLLA